MGLSAYFVRKYNKRKRKLRERYERIRRYILKRYFNYRELDFVIPAEVSNDQFSEMIHDLVSKPDVKTVIEIGSSSGAGSTKAFIDGIRKRPDAGEMAFYCMEVSTGRYAELKKFTDQYPFARAFNLSSVSTRRFPTAEEVSRFYSERETKLNNFPLEMVQSWRRNDIEYITATGRDVNGIQAIKATYGIETFDLCLIDGSEFTGMLELQDLLGARYILLDDTETFKCREAFEYLMASEDYSLLAHDPDLRHGFAAFMRCV